VTLDLSQIEQQILMLIAGLILAILTVAAKRFMSWLGIKQTDAQMAQLDDVAGKALTYGVTQAQATIKAKGWDHVDVKDQVVATAAQYAVQKFPDALKGAGIDTTSVNAAANDLQGVLQRKFPEVAAVMVTSPATPPGPPPLAAVPAPAS
jgi:uncharacterized protein with gpF-like domain